MTPIVESHDWSQSPIGSPAQWPVSLRTLVALTTDMADPVLIGWGRELCLIHNHAARSILRPNSKAGLGHPFRDAFPEQWPTIAPAVGRALAGEAAALEDIVFRASTNGTTSSI